MRSLLATTTLLVLSTFSFVGCASKDPSTGTSATGQQTEYKAESAAKKQNRMYEAMQRNFRSLTY